MAKTPPSFIEVQSMQPLAVVHDTHMGDFVSAAPESKGLFWTHFKRPCCCSFDHYSLASAK